jgi:hypothetical protein
VGAAPWGTCDTLTDPEHRVFHFSTDNLQASAAIGTHPGSSRPLVFGADATAFINGLARPGITSQFNDLLKPLVPALGL